MWKELPGTVKRFAGSSGTVAIPRGASVIGFTAHCTSAGSITFWDGVGGTVTIPVPANTWFVYDPKHTNAIANSTTAAQKQITFTTTDSYFVEIHAPNGV